MKVPEYTLLYIMMVINMTNIHLNFFRYLIPGSFVPNLYVATLSTKFIPVEDAFTTGYENIFETISQVV